MHPTEVLEKPSQQAVKYVKRQHASVDMFLDTNEYTEGFDDTSLDEALELLAILSTEDGVLNRIVADRRQIVRGFATAYTEQGETLGGYAAIADRLEETFAEAIDEIDLAAVVYERLEAVVGDTEALREVASSLRSNVAPRTVNIANELALVIAACDIEQGEDVERVIDDYGAAMYETRAAYYAREDGTAIDINELNFINSEAKARQLEYRLRVGTATDRPEAFALLLFFRGQSRIEDERHGSLVSPRTTHVHIGRLFLEACGRVSASIGDFEGYRKLYIQQATGMIATTESEHTDAARSYFEAAQTAQSVDETRRLKLISHGFQELAKNYSKTGDRYKMYRNGAWFFAHRPSPSSDDEQTLCRQLRRELELEQRICEALRVEDELDEVETRLREAIGKANSLVQGNEKYLHEDKRELERLLERLDE